MVVVRLRLRPDQEIDVVARTVVERLQQGQLAHSAWSAAVKSDGRDARKDE
jgi:hypothetical protein